MSMGTSGKLWRLVAAALALTLVVAVAGCGGDDDEAPDVDEIAEVEGFDGETITVGALTPASGPIAVIGEPLTRGNQVWFDYINEEEGGIAGQYQVEMVEADTRYEPPTAVQQYNGMRDNVVLFAQILGTPIIFALLEQLQADNVAAGPATLDADWVRAPNLIPNGAPYQIQAINSIDYWIEEEGSADANICAMTQDDPYGEAGLEGVEFAAEELGFEIAEAVTYRVGDEDFTGQIAQLSGADCEMVFSTSLPEETGTALGTAAELGFAPRWILQSPAWVESLGQSPLAEYLQQTTWVVAEGPQWGDEDVEGMRDMIERQERYAPEQTPDFYFTFGYSQAQAVTEVLEKAVELGDLSREGILNAIQEVDVVEFDGLGGDYTYGPIEDRDPPRENSIFSVDPGAPFGLSALEVNFSADAAEEYEFEG